MADIGGPQLQKVAKIFDIKTTITIGSLLVTMAAAWATMATKVDRINADMDEIKTGYHEADLRLQSQVDDVSGALALQAVSLGKIEAGVAYIQRSIEGLQKGTAP